MIYKSFITPLQRNENRKMDKKTEKKINIDKRDIIEAEFEDIKETSADNSK